MSVRLSIQRVLTVFCMVLCVYIVCDRLVRDIVEAYEQTNAEVDPLRQARDFVRKFELKFGMTHPEFVESGWKEAAAQAHRECKFLWVYIHAPDHEVRMLLAAEPPHELCAFIRLTLDSLLG